MCLDCHLLALCIAGVKDKLYEGLQRENKLYDSIKNPAKTNARGRPGQIALVLCMPSFASLFKVNKPFYASGQ